MTWLWLLLAGLFITSCSKKGTDDSDYVSVQIENSKMWSLLDVSNGTIVMTDEFFAPSSRVVNGAFFVENEKGEFDLYNLKDTKNKLNRNSFSIVTNFNSAGFAITRVKSEPWQIIDTESNVIATLDKELGVFSGFSEDGMAKIANKEGMFGFVNTKGELVIKPRYKFATIFSDGIAFVLTKEEEGTMFLAAIDITGQTVFSFSNAKYSNVGSFNEGYMFAVEGDHSVLLDKKGKKVMTVCDGTQISNLSYHDGKIIYYDGEFYGVKNIEDKILIRAKYKYLRFQSDGNLIAQNSNSRFGVIDTQDDVVTPFDYEMLEYLAPGKYMTISGNVAVLINSEGKEICDQAFSKFINRSSTASEGNLASLISAKSNEVTNALTDLTNALSSSLDVLDLNTLSEVSNDDFDFSFDSDSSDDSLDGASTSSEGLHNGEHEGLVDGKTKIILEITSISDGKIYGNIFYPNAVKKYGKTSQTLMPFSGTVNLNGSISLIVKSPTDATYGEDWLLMPNGDGSYSGDISNTKGKEWTVEFNSL